MPKVYRFLGRKGRTTIPFELRAAMELAPNDLLSFQLKGGLLIVQKEKVCDDCTARRRQKRTLPAVPEDWDAFSQEEQMQYINLLAAQLRRTTGTGAVRR